MLRFEEFAHVMEHGMKMSTSISPLNRIPLDLNRPGIPGDSIPWKRGWSHAREAPHNKEVPA